MGSALAGVLALAGAPAATGAPPGAARVGGSAPVAEAAPHYPIGGYIEAVYRDLFGRRPDPTGLMTWTWQLTHGVPYAAVADAITGSDEFRAGLIRQAYREYLEREPDVAGLDNWLEQMRRGMHIQEMEIGFLASPEYYGRVGGTDDAWVRALYLDVLRRPAAPGEVASWAAIARASGREGVARGFLYSTERLTTDVNGYYLWLLHRGLDPSGQITWVRAIQAGTRVEVILAGIIGSAEYRGYVPTASAPTADRPYWTGANVPLAARPFPAGDAWNTAIAGAPVDPASATLIASIGASDRLHPDFGANWDGGPFGIPYVVVGPGQARVPVTFGYADESDPGPYPVPPDAPVEGGPSAGGDRHVLVVDGSTQTLYELYDAHPQPDGSWTAGSGAVFDLVNGTSRPAGWTSADAAGLPILPGLVRYDEVAAGHIDHALRFTVAQTRRAYVPPATHYASSNRSASLPPMGMRVRLKASFDISGFPPQARVILQAMQTYGMIVADNGSDWYVSGAPDARWDDGQLGTLKTVPGSAFEVVQMGAMTTG